jgi:hypothetical protein
MSENTASDPFMVSIPSAEIQGLEVDTTCHVFVNGRELPECETYAWFEAAIQEKAARERLDENGLVRCGCGGKAVRHIIGHQHMVVCENDCVWTLWHDTQAEADKAWNTAHGYKEDI